MLKKGDQVRHDQFGDGEVVEVLKQTVLVRWDEHRTDSGKEWSHVNHESVRASARE